MNEQNHIITDQIVVFALDEQLYGLSLPSVVTVIHAIEVRNLPQAPGIISGIVNVRGQIIPVADIRKRFGLANREMDINDQIIIASTGKREIAIPVDNVNGIRKLTLQQMSAANDTFSFAKNLSGVAKIDDSLVLIYDLERFFSLDEEKDLEQSLKNMKNES